MKTGMGPKVLTLRALRGAHLKTSSCTDVLKSCRTLRRDVQLSISVNLLLGKTAVLQQACAGNCNSTTRLTLYHLRDVNKM
jgi:hypothetical protein